MAILALRSSATRGSAARAFASWRSSTTIRRRPGARSTTCPSSRVATWPGRSRRVRSEEHTSELQSRSDLVCRLLLEKKKNVAAFHVDQHICCVDDGIFFECVEFVAED